MGKNNKNKTLPETSLDVSQIAKPSAQPILDTHTHLLSTYEEYKRKYPTGACVSSIYDFVKTLYAPAGVEAIIDVWCEAPVTESWKALADSALTEDDRAQLWGGLQYWFVMGVHPHNTIDYTDEVHSVITEAMKHPRCVGLGEIGLDYHYDNSPRDVQRTVLRRQLQLAIECGKPLTIHTREAEDDTELILKEVVPRDWKIHIHCFTDSPAFAQRLLDHFPNLCIGITGVITYATNLNTSALIRAMVASSDSAETLRIVLETDAPYMIPANIYPSLNLPGNGGRLPISHPGMIPWTAEFIAGQAGDGWDAERVMKVARANARKVYGV